MNLKIFYRSPVVWNTILATLFSFAFIYSQHLAYTNTSLFNTAQLISFAYSKAVYLALLAITSLAIYRMSPLAKPLILITIVATISLTALNLSVAFSKIVLIIMFCYILMSYYFFRFYSDEIKESYYCPSFESEELFEPMLYRIDCEIDFEGGRRSGYLTNWSEEGGFIYFKKKEKLKITSEENMSISWEDNSFKFKATIASIMNTGAGVGFRVIKESHDSQKKELGWRDFYEIITDMGFSPELLA